METLFRQLNPHACQTYLIENPKTREAVLIDPVLEHVPDYLQLIDKEKLVLSTIIDTHTHADHISGGAALRDQIPAQYVMHEAAVATCPTLRVQDGAKMNLAGLPATFMATPGHTKDSLSILLPGKILTGDALFLDDGGAGRDDLPGGDAGQHWESLQRLLGLPEDLMVYPAHEYRHRQPSSLKQQKRTNPHLQHATREDYIRYLQDLKLGPADWMKDVLKANYACARDPKAAWIPVDVPACEIKGTLSAGANDLKVDEISPADFLKLPAGSQPLLLDVRDPEELKGDLGALPGAVNIPVTALAHRLSSLEPHKNNRVITICRSGGRAHTAAQILMQAGFTHVQKLAGGMTAIRQLAAKA